MTQRYSLSLAAPAYNEVEGIEAVVSDWIAYLEKAEFVSDYEIVVCNDGSKDATGAILDKMAEANPHVKPVQMQKNQGAAAALTTAIAHTTKDWVLLVDSDG